MIIRPLIVPLIVAALAAGVTELRAQGAFPAPLPNGTAAGTVNDPAFPPVRGSVGTPNDPAFPPVNGRRAAAPRNDPAFPPVNGATPARLSAPGGFPSGGAAPVLGGGFGAPPPQQAGPPPGAEECMKQFLPLREAAEKRGKLIQAASARHAPPDEACKLIGNYSQAELKMIKFIDTHAQKCGIPPNVGQQMRTSHKGTESTLQKVCEMAKQVKLRGPAGPSLSDILSSSTSEPQATTAKKGGSTFDTLSGNVLTR